MPGPLSVELPKSPFRQTPAINAADILTLVKDSQANAGWLDQVIFFAAKIPACSGNILEIHPGKKTDFAARLNHEFDASLITTLSDPGFPFYSKPLPGLLIPGSGHHIEGIENIWIEYDAPFKFTPAIFLDIDRNKEFRIDLVYLKLQKLAEYIQVSLPCNLRTFLQKVARLDLRVVYYGFMFSRQQQSIRLTITGIRKHNLVNILEHLGWRGNYEQVCNISAEYLTDNQQLVLGVDLGNELQQRIGLEIFDPNPRAFARKLTAGRLLEEDQLAQILSWQKTIELNAGVSQHLTILHNRPVKNLYTRVNHFKFLFDSSEKNIVKNYLYYCF